MFKPSNSSVAYYVVDKSCATLSSYMYISYLTGTGEQERCTSKSVFKHYPNNYLLVEKKLDKILQIIKKCGSVSNNSHRTCSPFDRVCIMSINCVTSFEYRGNVLYEKHKYSENARLYILIKKGMPL